MSSNTFSFVRSARDTAARTLPRWTVLAFATVSVACGGGSKDAPTAPVTPAPTVQSITVTPATATLSALGASTTLAADVRLSNGTASSAAVTWTSSNPAAVTVSGNTATAIGNGTSTITATVGTVSGTAAVTVQQVVASVALLPADTVAKTGFRLRGAALDARGNAVAGSAVQITALAPNVSTTDQAGNLSPQSTGVARFRVTAGTLAATSIVRTIWNVRQVSDLYPLYEYSATSGARRVFSDVSQAHADARVAIVNTVWNALSAAWPANGSPNTDFYFTASRVIWAETLPFCGGQDLPNQTAWTQCAQAGGRQHFLVPEGDAATNDYFNIARFLTRQFVLASHTASSQFPWFVEGYSALAAGGQVTNNAIVGGLARVTRFDIRRGDSTAVLAPLDSLLRLTQVDFYRDLSIRTPVAIRQAESAAFLAYLNNDFPTVLPALVARIRATGGSALTNEDIIQFILTQTGRTLPQLQTGFTAYVRALPAPA